MAPRDPVPEADRLEQEMPPARDEREMRPLRPEQPDADTLEQELPLAEAENQTVGIDSERVEPASDDGWQTTRS